MTGREWKGAAASLLLHGALMAVALAPSGFAHDADTTMVIDFSLLPSRISPGKDPAGISAKSAEAERPAANTPVAEKGPAEVKPPPPVQEIVSPPREPAPLLQKETATAAPVPLPVEQVKETVDDLLKDPRIVEPAVTAGAAPPVSISDADPPSSSEDKAGASETLSDNDRIAHLGSASGEGVSSPAGSHGGHPLLTEGTSEAAGAGGDSSGGTHAPERDFSYIREKVQRNTRYPRIARQMGLEGMVKVSFTVCDDGQVTDVEVMESSGVSMLDKCAVDAVRKTSPFPSRRLEAKVIIPIVYRLK
jgi:protein TonB